MSFIKIHSLSKNRRLHKAEEFSAVIRVKCTVSGDFLQVYAKPNNATFSRLGLIVAKRIERRAVRRNRVKRVLREAFRMTQQDSDVRKMDWVVRLRRPITRNDSFHLAIEVKLLMLQLLQQCRD
nr:ribonuclease P protein component [Nitrosomonas cryotolerans]